ncbi:MAG TPA: PHP domain-containing protein [Caldilineae bacterium]|nr:PHP domain-containing protein [Caldilineae bacterium]
MTAGTPFAVSGRWFKGNLHMHTTMSDGQRTPEDAVAWYRAHGYDFVSVTDHVKLTQTAHLSTSDFLTIPGTEYHGEDPDVGPYHVVAWGMTELPPHSESMPLQQVIDAFRERQAIVSIAHPYWCGQMSGDLLAVNGYMGIEIFNATCQLLNAKGFSNVHWDELLAAGRRVWGLAVDDTHWRPQRPDVGQGWVMVKAAALTQQAILQALEAGHFYASCGPTIEDLEIDGQRVWVRCSPCAQINFISDRWHGQVVRAAPGQVLTEAEYQIEQETRYVRVECVDVEGRHAWSNPFMLI